jgi:hypothetical protein
VTPDVRKLIRRVVLAFGITLVLSVIATTVIGRFIGNEASLASSLLLAFTPAFFAASIACWTTIVPVDGGERDMFGANQSLQKTVTRAVMRPRSDGADTVGDPAEQLTPPQRHLAARFAAIQSVALPFQVGQGLFALVAMMFFAASNVLDAQKDFDAAYLFALALGTITIATVLPIALRRWHTIKRYRDDHQEDLVDAG